MKYNFNLFIYLFFVHTIYTNCPLELIRSFLPPNPIIVEAGAHFGEDTQIFASKWPSGLIYAFEPFPDSYQKLRKKVRLYSNVVTYQMALSNQTGSALFFYSLKHPGCSSLISPTSRKAKSIPFEKNPIIVSTITLDDLAQLCGIDHIDFVWLDVEGFELPILQASKTIFKTVKVIFLEVNYIALHEKMPLADEVVDWLKSQGFIEILRLDFAWGWLKNGQPGQSNVLMVRGNF